jgi:hypothetical protein
MNLALFGGLNQRPFPPGWTKETVVAILGGGDLDLSNSPAGPHARLTAVAILGGVKVILAPGTHVSVSGAGILGGREVKVSQTGDGPEVKMNLWAILGGIEVSESDPADAG